MKGLGVLLAIGIAAVAGFWWTTSKAMSDPGIPVAIAFGNPRNDLMEMHVIIAMGMTAAEGPRRDLMSGRVLWAEWIEEHFYLRDASDQPVTLKYRQGNSLIPDHMAGVPQISVYRSKRVVTGNKPDANSCSDCH